MGLYTYDWVGLCISGLWGSKFGLSKIKHKRKPYRVSYYDHFLQTGFLKFIKIIPSHLIVRGGIGVTNERQNIDIMPSGA